MASSKIVTTLSNFFVVLTCSPPGNGDHDACGHLVLRRHR